MSPHQDSDLISWGKAQTVHSLTTPGDSNMQSALENNDLGPEWESFALALACL